ncbi:MAG: MutS2/Smr-associated SH3 domain-containing protein, partial [Bacteroidota bacterium]
VLENTSADNESSPPELPEISSFTTVHRQRQEKKKKIVKDRSLMVVGATVRLEKTKQVGEIIEVLGESATVAFGNFKTKVELQRLILIP